MVADRNEDIDVIGIAEDDLEAAIFVFCGAQGSGSWPAFLRHGQGRGVDAQRG